ncbi:MAG TPA: hypothetical protein VGK22_02640 [Candidatus Angelobacter sp.]|jgi:hypothetical protein
MEDSGSGNRAEKNMRVAKTKATATSIEEKLTIRVPGPISEVLVDAELKVGASGISGLILDHKGGWAVGGYLAVLLKRKRAKP